MLPLPGSVPFAPARQALFFFFPLFLFLTFLFSQNSQSLIAKFEFIECETQLCGVANSEKMELILLVFLHLADLNQWYVYTAKTRKQSVKKILQFLNQD